MFDLIGFDQGCPDQLPCVFRDFIGSECFETRVDEKHAFTMAGRAGAIAPLALDAFGHGRIRPAAAPEMVMRAPMD
ncbi:hypothetical protein [Streptomyces californicus]|uniref:hypothetical protein n=1 Tax=Streptomyces californicus TaxID=67351 RepID=UPI0037A7362C